MEIILFFLFLAINDLALWSFISYEVATGSKSIWLGVLAMVIGDGILLYQNIFLLTTAPHLFGLILIIMVTTLILGSIIGYVVARNKSHSNTN